MIIFTIIGMMFVYLLLMFLVTMFIAAFVGGGEIDFQDYSVGISVAVVVSAIMLGMLYGDFVEHPENYGYTKIETETVVNMEESDDL